MHVQLSTVIFFASCVNKIHEVLNSENTSEAFPIHLTFSRVVIVSANAWQVFHLLEKMLPETIPTVNEK